MPDLKRVPIWYRWLLLSGVWFLYAIFGLVATSLSPLVLLIESDLSLTHVQMGTIMGAWQLVYIFSAIPCGIFLDRVGPRIALTIGVLLIGLSVFARGYAGNFTELLLAVMLFGLGGPIISAGAPKVVTEWFEGSSRGLAMGIYMTGPAIGGIISLTMTHSILLPAFGESWREVMYLWAGVGVVGALVWLLVTSHPAMQAGMQARKQEHTSSSSLPQGQILRLLIKQPAVLLVLTMSVGVFLFNHGLNNWLPELLRTAGMSLIEAGYWAAVPTVIVCWGLF
jgi:CP family cyanate transporter-like MFS transporter